MCAIAGYAGHFLPNLATRMNATQAHRGPDDQGIFEDHDAGIALGHGRLAILDLDSVVVCSPRRRLWRDGKNGPKSIHFRKTL
jgi:asparagine synthetase B (glutamine-hydrolysing)